MLHIHFYRDHHWAGVNKYLECRCGERKVLRPSRGYSPLDRDWLNGGLPSIQTRIHPKPPKAPGGVSKPAATEQMYSNRELYLKRVYENISGDHLADDTWHLKVGEFMYSQQREINALKDRVGTLQSPGDLDG